MRKLLILLIALILSVVVLETSEGGSGTLGDKVLLIIGQDLDSCLEYRDTGLFPEPGGVTTYTDIYMLYGLDTSANWGAGRMNAQEALKDFPHSVLSIGLYMVEDANHPDGLMEIAKGKYDFQIDKLAQFIAAANRPVFVRIGYEFDGVWNHYSPEKYKAAFKHVVVRMREKADNFFSVWQSCASPINVILRNGRPPDISRWYPGDEYVDWIGLSWFLSGDPMQHKLADDVLNFAREHGKRVMIAEATPQGYDLAALTKADISPIYDGPAGQNRVHKTPEEIWDEWFVPFFDYIYANTDVIKAVAYINADWDTQPMWGSPYTSGYWGDSRVQVNDVITKNWLREVTKPLWLHAAPNLFEVLDIPWEVNDEN